LEGALPSGGMLGDRGRADYAQNRWSAARFGPAAELLHPDGTRVVRASELGAELVELIRPAAAALGGGGALDRLDPTRCEGAPQSRHATPQDATADVVARSLG